MSRYRVIRYLGYSIEILVLFVLQETPGLIPEIGGARPVMLIPAAVCIAMFEHETPAMVFGLAGGLLADFGAGGLLGFHGLLLAVFCFVISLMAANLFQTNFFTALLTCAISEACITLLQWVFFFVVHGYAYPLYALTAHYLPIFCYTFALTPVAYAFNRGLALQIRSKEE